MEHLLDHDITGSINSQKYLCTITWRNGKMLMDEPERLGGQDLGPDPYSVLLASLAGCTLSTLRMYIDRKGWDIPVFSVTLNMSKNSTDQTETIISRKLVLPQAISKEQKDRLLFIAEKCPVSKILENKITINTQL